MVGLVPNPEPILYLLKKLRMTIGYFKFVLLHSNKSLER